MGTKKKEKFIKTIKLRLSVDDYSSLIFKANIYHEGNMSELIRDAVRDYRQKKNPSQERGEEQT